MNMFKTTPATTPEEYIKLLAEPRKSQIKTLYDFISQTVPNLKPHILSGMIGFGTYHYKYASGREGDWSYIALASQKNYISVYICSTEGNKYLPEIYNQKLGKVSVGKSCIRFKKLEDINLDILKEMLLKTEQFSNNQP